MTTCPSCGVPVDAMRATAVRVVGTKVVAYCSAACAQEASGKVVATAVVATPSVPVPAPVEPVSAKAVSVAAAAATASSKASSLPTVAKVVSAASPGALAGAKAVREAPAASAGAPSSRGSAKVWVTVGGAVVVLGGVLAWWLLRPSAPSAIHAPAIEAAPAPPPVAPIVDRAAEVAALVAQAEAKLRDLATAEDLSSRVRGLAAAALARVDLATATPVLVAQMEGADSPAEQLAAAYALARAGDARGHARLTATLKVEARDDRADAGRLLARLGDTEARAALGPLMQLAQLRLAAAEALAPLHDPKALTLLAELSRDQDKPQDDRRRALVALGRAGDPSVAPALRELLEDARWRAPAAAALARIGDASAEPVLASQLAVAPLRVEAALALRRLAPMADRSALALALAPALAAERELDLVACAEAILLLTGPSARAERD